MNHLLKGSFAAIVGAVLAASVVAADGPRYSDEISTSAGWFDTPAANQELRSWRQRAGASDEFRTRTRGCLQILNDVADHEREAQRLGNLARQNRGNSAAMRYYNASRAEKAIAADFIVQFWQGCVDKQMGPAGDQFNTADTPEPPARPTPQPAVPQNQPRPPAARPTPRPAVPQQQPQPPRLQAGTERRIERICDLQQLAVHLFRRYGAGSAGPVARVKVANADKPTYVLFLSGMEWDKRNQATLAGDALIAWSNIQALNAYRWAIFDAVADLDPRTTNLIIVGHSQGGMEAQGVIESLKSRWGYNVPQVITYGAPIIRDRLNGTDYLHIRAPDDPVIALDRRYSLSGRDILFSARGTKDPHRSYETAGSGLSTFRVPSVSTLRTPCYELEINTLEEFSAPNLFQRVFSSTPPPGKSPTPLNPGGPGTPQAPPVNCFWTSMAQEEEWATGLPIPAQCEAKPIKTADVPPQLAIRYGGRKIDDLQGPTPEEGIRRHVAGEPARSSRQAIEATLPKGGRGMVFVALPDPKNPLELDPKHSGHVFNVRRHADGKFEYRDAQTGRDPTWWFATPDLHVFFYRTH